MNTALQDSVTEYIESTDNTFGSSVEVTLLE